MSNSTVIHKTVLPELINGDHFMGEMVFMILFARMISWFFNYFKLPRVVGDMVENLKQQFLFYLFNLFI